MKTLSDFGIRSIALPVLCFVVLATVFVSEKMAVQPPELGPVHISYWEKWTEFEFGAMKSVVDDFNASQNRIHVDILSISGIENKTLMAISAGIPPDVAGLYGANLPQYADDHAVEMLDDRAAKAGIVEKNYIKPYWDMGYYQGHLWSLVSVPATTALHYNRSLFANAGLDPDKAPLTIEDLNADSEKITKLRGDGKLAVAGFLPNEPGWWNWAWGYYFGGQLWDGKGKITANSPENVRAFEWIQSFTKKNGKDAMLAFKQGLGNFSSPQNAFMSDEVAMEVQGVWMANFIKKYKPELQWNASSFPHPADRPDLADTTMVDEDILVIPKGCKHPDEAFEFIKYVQSQPEMEKLCLLQQKNSPLTQVSNSFWKSHGNKKIKLFYDLAYSKNSVPPPKMGIWPEYLAEINSTFDSVTVMTKTPKQALDELTARMQPKLDLYMARIKQREERGL